MMRFRKGELALVRKDSHVRPELRGRIVEVLNGPGEQTAGGRSIWGYRVRYAKDDYTQDYVCKAELLIPLPPPGDPQRDDEDYDGEWVAP